MGRVCARHTHGGLGDVGPANSQLQLQPAPRVHVGHAKGPQVLAHDEQGGARPHKGVQHAALQAQPPPPDTTAHAHGHTWHAHSETCAHTRGRASALQQICEQCGCACARSSVSVCFCAYSHAQFEGRTLRKRPIPSQCQRTKWAHPIPVPQPHGRRPTRCPTRCRLLPPNAARRPLRRSGA